MCALVSVKRRIVSPWGEMWLFVSSQGLCGLSLPDSDLPDSALLDNSGCLESANTSQATMFADMAEEALIRYCECHAHSSAISSDISAPLFSNIPLAVQGTSFMQTVWQALRQLPWGHTASYGEIARAIGRPSAARAVGMACGRNPVPIFIPCHRVIGASGRLTGFRGGLALKKALLAHEGLGV